MPLSVPCNSDDKGNDKTNSGIIAVIQRGNFKLYWILYWKCNCYCQFFVCSSYSCLGLLWYPGLFLEKVEENKVGGVHIISAILCAIEQPQLMYFLGFHTNPLWSLLFEDFLHGHSPFFQSLTPFFSSKNLSNKCGQWRPLAWFTSCSAMGRNLKGWCEWGDGHTHVVSLIFGLNLQYTFYTDLLDVSP